MPADNSLDKETRKVDQMRPDKNNQYQIYQKSQNQLLQIQAAQKQNLMLQRANSNALRNQNATLQQAAQLAAMSGGASTIQQSVNPQTQATLQKYGMGKPRFQRQQSSSQQVTKQNVVIHNNTTNNTTNNVRAGGYGGPVQGRDLRLKDPTIGFKTWIANTFAKQQEQAQIRDREFEKREASLTRNSNKMMRKFEGIGKTLSERFDPGKMTSNMGKQFKALMFLLGLQHLRKNWKLIISKLSEYWEGFKKFAGSFGITFDGNASISLEKARQSIKTNFSSFGAQLIIAFGGNPRTETIGSILHDLIIGEPNNRLKYGLWQRAKDYLDVVFKERADAMREVNFPAEAFKSILTGDDVIKNLPKALEWLGNIISVGFGGAEALRAIKFNQTLDVAEEKIETQSNDGSATGSWYDSNIKTSDVKTHKRSFKLGPGNETFSYYDGRFMDESTKAELAKRGLSDMYELGQKDNLVGISKDSHVPISLLKDLVRVYDPNNDNMNSALNKFIRNPYMKDFVTQDENGTNVYHGALGELMKDREFWDIKENREELKEAVRGYRNFMYGKSSEGDSHFFKFSSGDVEEVILSKGGSKTILGTCSGILCKKSDKGKGKKEVYGRADINQLTSVEFYQSKGDRLLRNLSSGTICYTGELTRNIHDGGMFLHCFNILQKSLTEATKLHGNDFIFMVDTDSFPKIVIDNRIVSRDGAGNIKSSRQPQELFPIIRDRSASDLGKDSDIMAFINGYVDQSAANATGWGTFCNAAKGVAAGGAAAGVAAFCVSNPVGWVVGTIAVGVALTTYAVGKSPAFEGAWRAFWNGDAPSFTGDMVTINEFKKLQEITKPVKAFNKEFCPGYLSIPNVYEEDSELTKGFCEIVKILECTAISKNINGKAYHKEISSPEVTRYKAYTIKYSEWKAYVRYIFNNGSEELKTQLSDDNFNSFSINDSNYVDITNAWNARGVDGGAFYNAVNYRVDKLKETTDRKLKEIEGRSNYFNEYRTKVGDGYKAYISDFGENGAKRVDSAIDDAINVARTEFTGDFLGSTADINSKLAPLLGVMYSESGLDPTKKEANGGPGRGLLQWTTPERKKRILDYINETFGKKYKDITEASSKEQLQAALWEMKKHYPDLYEEFKNSTNPQEMAERLKHSSFVMGNRGEYIDALDEAFKKKHKKEATQNDLNRWGKTWDEGGRKARNYTNSIVGNFAPEKYSGDITINGNGDSTVDEIKSGLYSGAVKFKDLLEAKAKAIYENFMNAFKNKEDRRQFKGSYISFPEWKSLKGNHDGSFMEWQREMEMTTGKSPEDRGISGEGSFLDYINSNRRLRSSSVYGIKAIKSGSFNSSNIAKGVATDINASVEQALEGEKTEIDYLKEGNKKLDEIAKGIKGTAYAIAGNAKINEETKAAVDKNTQATVATGSGNNSKVERPQKTK